jgi:hydroxymethylpyrimidine/phosphomethylpyrimidine kinase
MHASAGRVRNVLIASGLDPSGGAGFLLDSRIVVEAGARPLGVITAHTVQTTEGVVAAHPVDAELLDAQLTHLLGDVEIAAVKIGMLGAEVVAEVLGAALERVAGPVVWDPVLAPSKGRVPLYTGSVAAAIKALRPSLTLITPNAMEAALLTGLPVTTPAEVAAAARALREVCECAVLIKGGHLGVGRGEAAASGDGRAGGDAAGAGGASAGGASGDDVRDGDGESIDTLLPAPGHGDDVVELRGPRIPGGERVHGTGCALASAIAAHLALGAALERACRLAKAQVAAHIGAPVRAGRGAASIG